MRMRKNIRMIAGMQIWNETHRVHDNRPIRELTPLGNVLKWCIAGILLSLALAAGLRPEVWEWLERFWGLL